MSLNSTQSPPAKVPTLNNQLITESFRQATSEAVANLHASDIDACGLVDGVWQRVPPPGKPSWDVIWMKMAHVISERSIDPRLKCGVVIVTDDNTRVLAVGYNGNYKGGPNTVDSMEPGQSGFIHAEENALIKLDFDFPKRKIMYMNVSPCVMCAKKIINANIDEVIYDKEYRIRDGIELLKSAMVLVRRFQLP